MGQLNALYLDLERARSDLVDLNHRRIRHVACFTAGSTNAASPFDFLARACAYYAANDRCAGHCPRRNRTAQFAGPAPSLGSLAMRPHSQHLGCNASGSVAPQGPATSPQRQCSMGCTAPQASPHDQLWRLVPQVHQPKYHAVITLGSVRLRTRRPNHSCE